MDTGLRLAMHIPRIDQAIRQCQAYLSADTPVEVRDLLVRSLLVLIYAEFEQKIISLVEEKCALFSDKSVEKFVSKCIREILRSPRISELRGLLGRFGETHKERFASLLEEKEKNMYTSLINNRNQAAHGDEVKTTFRDIREYYEHAHPVLDHFRESLFQSTTDET